MAPPVHAQAPVATGPVELWLSPPRGAEGLAACAQPEPNRPWVLAQAHASLVQIHSLRGEPVWIGRLGAGGAGNDWPGQCFQLRRNTTVLWQGAVVSAAQVQDHTQALTLPVLTLENRARHEPRLTLSCGLPAPTATGPGTCQHGFTLK